MKRLKVVVLYGGRSVEREVSRVSARTIVGGLDRSRYEVVPLAVDPSGRFLSAADSSRMLAEGPVPDRFRRAEPAGGALVPLEISAGRADVVFPIIHGTSGEDGTLQGFLEFLGIPYVGAGVAGSAIGISLCCERNPVKTCISPLSIFIGSDTVRTRFGLAKTSCKPLSSFISLDASSSCLRAISNGFIAAVVPFAVSSMHCSRKVHVISFVCKL